MQEPNARWFKGPSGEAFMFDCGPRGVHVPTLAAELQLKERPLKVNGVLVDFDQHGYRSWQEPPHVIGGLGLSKDSPILVDGQPVGESSRRQAREGATRETDLQVVVPRQVLLRCRGAGAPLEFLVQLHEGRLHIPSIKEVLATRKLQLLTIKQMVLATDGQGYTDMTFNDKEEVVADVCPKPVDDVQELELAEKRKARRWQTIQVLVTVVCALVGVAISAIIAKYFQTSALSSFKCLTQDP